MDWDSYFIDIAFAVARKSKDRSVKLGVVIVGQNNEIVSTGFNGFPRGIDDTVERYHDRSAKYQYTEHAERNAIYNAARNGIRIDGCTMYATFEPIACTECARALIQAGIKRMIGPKIVFEGKGVQWKSDLEVADKMLKEAGIEQVWVDYNITKILIPKGLPNRDEIIAGLKKHGKTPTEIELY